MRAAPLVALAALAGLALAPACRAPAPAPAPQAKSPAETPAAPPAAAPARSPALGEYEEAQRLILAEQDIVAGIARLERAVALDPGFGEAWYQLGTARLTTAAATRTVDRAHALAAARRGVADCRRALELAVHGSLRVWDAFELADAVADLRETLALFGDDAQLADDQRAGAALERWATAKGFDAPPAGAAAEGEEP